MKIAIVGCGAIGGYVGAKLARAGEQVTFLVRGANLEALRAQGVKLIQPEGEELVARNLNATADYAEAGPQDLVIIAIKAHQLPAIVEQVSHLFGRDTAVVTMQNGIPYWYFHQHGGGIAGTGRGSVDPDGGIRSSIPAE